MAASSSWLGRCTNAAERRERNSSKRSRSASALSTRRRSSMSAARHMSGMATTLRISWSEGTYSATGRRAKRPRAWVAAQMATSVVVSSERLAPSGPKRTAAQSRKGNSHASGETGGPARAAMTPLPAAKTKMEAVSKRTPSSAASVRRRGEGRRAGSRKAQTAVRMAGATVSSVRTFEENRVRQTSQYGSPPNDATAAASANEETKGATSAAPAMKTTTRRRVSSSAGASLNWRT